MAHRAWVRSVDVLMRGAMSLRWQRELYSQCPCRGGGALPLHLFIKLSDLNSAAKVTGVTPESIQIHLVRVPVQQLDHVLIKIKKTNLY